MTKEQEETRTNIDNSDDKQYVHIEAKEKGPAKTAQPPAAGGTAKATDSPEGGESLELSKQEAHPESSKEEEALESSEQEAPPEPSEDEEALVPSEPEEDSASEDDLTSPEILDSETDISSEDFSRRILERDESSEYAYEIKKGQRVLTSLRKCMNGAFADAGELRDFCQDYLGEDVIYRLPQNAAIADLVRTIILYCRSRAQLDILYDFLVAERPQRYASCYEEHQPFDPMGKLERLRRAGVRRLSAEEEQTPIEHPLTQSEEIVRRWFFKDLDQDEQSFVIAVALFEGANRHRMQRFYEEIRHLFPKSDERAAGDGQGDRIDGSTIEASEKEQTAKQTDETVSKSTLKDELDLFQKANAKIVLDTVHTEYGQAQVQTLRLAKPDQRGKVLTLLGQSLNNWLPTLYQYLRELGASSDKTDRHYAALAVGELMSKLSFFDLKNIVLKPWAEQPVYITSFDSKNRVIRDKLSVSVTTLSASQALAYVISDARCQQEALNLLRHWIGINKASLNVAALLTYSQICLDHPAETLEMIKGISSERKRQLLSLLPTVTFVGIVKSIYVFYPKLVIEYLHKWIVNSDPKQDASLRSIAGLLFLDNVRLDNIPTDDITEIRGNIVDIIFTLWDGLGMLMRSEIQKSITNLIECWVRTTIEAEHSEPDVFPTYHRVFIDLNEKYKHEKVENRLEFYLKTWGQYDKVFTGPIQ